MPETGATSVLNDNTVIVDNGSHRAIVGEHPDHLYLNVGSNRGGEAMFCSPLEALQIAGALITGAGRILERQFQKEWDRR